MTAVDTASTLSGQQLALMFQYTVEAYKTFEKFAETLPNPMTAMMFKQFAVDERRNRDLIEMKIAGAGLHGVRITLGADLIFSEIQEGELSYREAGEFLISRERTMQRKLHEFIAGASAIDRTLLIYFETTKRAHIVELERELEVLREDGRWWKREDAEWRIVHGAASA
jgi:hypothetical protein